jgi:hypothetical protein
MLIEKTYDEFNFGKALGLAWKIEHGGALYTHAVRLILPEEAACEVWEGERVLAEYFNELTGAQRGN